MPLKVFVVIVIVACLIPIINYAREYGSRREKFVAAIEAGIGKNESQFKSSVNMMLNVLPNSVTRTADLNYWNAFDRSFSKTASVIEGAYEEAATCVRSWDCVAGSNAKEYCKRISIISSQYQYIVDRLLSLTNGGGLIVDFTGDKSQTIGLGPVISVPNMRNLKSVAQSCS